MNQMTNGCKSISSMSTYMLRICSPFHQRILKNYDVSSARKYSVFSDTFKRSVFDLKIELQYIDYSYSYN